MLWKNGGGVTVEIAVFPENASVSHFDWRISTATIATDGPFSVFPDIDRTLSVLEGDGIILSVSGFPDQRLVNTALPFSFPADRVAGAKLIGSATTDLNVMTRRGRCKHHVRRYDISTQTHIKLCGETMIVFCADGQIAAGDEPLLLEKNDCLRLENCSPVDMHFTGHGTIFVIKIETT